MVTQVCVLFFWESQRDYQWLLGLNHTLQKHSPKPHTSKTHTPKQHTTETQPPEPHTPEQRFLIQFVRGCLLSGAAAHFATPRARAAAPVLISCLLARVKSGVPQTPAGGAPGSLTAVHKRSLETPGASKGSVDPSGEQNSVLFGVWVLLAVREKIRFFCETTAGTCFRVQRNVWFDSGFIFLRQSTEVWKNLAFCFVTVRPHPEVQCVRWVFSTLRTPTEIPSTDLDATVGGLTRTKKL